MKAGDLVFHDATQAAAVYVGASVDDRFCIVRFEDGSRRQPVLRRNVRHLTPEEQAAHALGWRGPGQQSNP